MPRLVKQGLSDCGPPYAVEDSSIRAQGYCSHVATGESRRAVYEEGIEHIAACSNRGGSAQSPQEAIVWKFLRERECADFNLALDLLKALTRPTEIGLGRRALNERTVSNSFKHEVELNSPSGDGDDTAREPLGAHGRPSIVWIKCRNLWIQVETSIANVSSGN